MRKTGPQNKASNKPITASFDTITGESISAADERKTVALNDDVSGAEFEDKVWYYWGKNKNFIIMLFVITLALIVGIQGWKYYKAQKFDALASAYESTTNAESRAAFALENSGSVIAGIALLQNADEAYAAKQYEKSAALYTDAVKSLGTSILSGRAKIGEAMSLFNTGNASEAKKLLTDISQDNTIDYSFRSEASYTLAVSELNGGNKETAKTMLETLVKDKNAGIWAMLAEEAIKDI